MNIFDIKSLSRERIYGLLKEYLIKNKTIDNEDIFINKILLDNKNKVLALIYTKIKDETVLDNTTYISFFTNNGFDTFDESFIEDQTNIKLDNTHNTFFKNIIQSSKILPLIEYIEMNDSNESDISDWQRSYRKVLAENDKFITIYSDRESHFLFDDKVQDYANISIRWEYRKDVKNSIAFRIFSAYYFTGSRDFFDNTEEGNFNPNKLYVEKKENGNRLTIDLEDNYSDLNNSLTSGGLMHSINTVDYSFNDVFPCPKLMAKYFYKSDSDYKISRDLLIYQENTMFNGYLYKLNAQKNTFEVNMNGDNLFICTNDLEDYYDVLKDAYIGFFHHDYVYKTIITDNVVKNRTDAEMKAYLKRIGYSNLKIGDCIYIRKRIRLGTKINDEIWVCVNASNRDFEKLGYFEKFSEIYTMKNDTMVKSFTNETDNNIYTSRNNVEDYTELVDKKLNINNNYSIDRKYGILEDSLVKDIFQFYTGDITLYDGTIWNKEDPLFMYIIIDNNNILYPLTDKYDNYLPLKNPSLFFGGKYFKVIENDFFTGSNINLSGIIFELAAYGSGKKPKIIFSNKNINSSSDNEYLLNEEERNNLNSLIIQYLNINDIIKDKIDINSLDYMKVLMEKKIESNILNTYDQNFNSTPLVSKYLTSNITEKEVKMELDNLSDTSLDEGLYLYDSNLYLLKNKSYINLGGFYNSIISMVYNDFTNEFRMWQYRYIYGKSPLIKENMNIKLNAISDLFLYRGNAKFISEEIFSFILRDDFDKVTDKVKNVMSEIIKSNNLRSTYIGFIFATEIEDDYLYMDENTDNSDFYRINVEKLLSDKPDFVWKLPIHIRHFYLDDNDNLINDKAEMVNMNTEQDVMYYYERPTQDEEPKLFFTCLHSDFIINNSYTNNKELSFKPFDKNSVNDNIFISEVVIMSSDQWINNDQKFFKNNILVNSYPYYRMYYGTVKDLNEEFDYDNNIAYINHKFFFDTTEINEIPKIMTTLSDYVSPEKYSGKKLLISNGRLVDNYRLVSEENNHFYDVYFLIDNYAKYFDYIHTSNFDDYDKNIVVGKEKETGFVNLNDDLYVIATTYQTQNQSIPNDDNPTVDYKDNEAFYTITDYEFKKYDELSPEKYFLVKTTYDPNTSNGNDNTNNIITLLQNNQIIESNLTRLINSKSSSDITNYYFKEDQINELKTKYNIDFENILEDYVPFFNIQYKIEGNEEYNNYFLISVNQYLIIVELDTFNKLTNFISIIEFPNEYLIDVKDNLICIVSKYKNDDRTYSSFIFNIKTFYNKFINNSNNLKFFILKEDEYNFKFKYSNDYDIINDIDDNNKYENYDFDAIEVLYDDKYLNILENIKIISYDGYYKLFVTMNNGRVTCSERNISIDDKNNTYNLIDFFKTEGDLSNIIINDDYIFMISSLSKVYIFDNLFKDNQIQSFNYIKDKYNLDNKEEIINDKKYYKETHYPKIIKLNSNCNDLILNDQFILTLNDEKDLKDNDLTSLKYFKLTDFPYLEYDNNIKKDGNTFTIEDDSNKELYMRLEVVKNPNEITKMNSLWEHRFFNDKLGYRYEYRPEEGNYLIYLNMRVKLNCPESLSDERFFEVEFTLCNEDDTEVSFPYRISDNNGKVNTIYQNFNKKTVKFENNNVYKNIYFLLDSDKIINRNNNSIYIPFKIKYKIRDSYYSENDSDNLIEGTINSNELPIIVDIDKPLIYNTDNEKYYMIRRRTLNDKFKDSIISCDDFISSSVYRDNDTTINGHEIQQYSLFIYKYNDDIDLENYSYSFNEYKFNKKFTNIKTINDETLLSEVHGIDDEAIQNIIKYKKLNGEFINDERVINFSEFLRGYFDYHEIDKFNKYNLYDELLFDLYTQYSCKFLTPWDYELSFKDILYSNMNSFNHKLYDNTVSINKNDMINGTQFNIYKNNGGLVDLSMNLNQTKNDMMVVYESILTNNENVQPNVYINGLKVFNDRIIYQNNKDGDLSIYLPTVNMKNYMLNDALSLILNEAKDDQTNEVKITNKENNLYNEIETFIDKYPLSNMEKIIAKININVKSDNDKYDENYKSEINDLNSSGIRIIYQPYTNIILEDSLSDIEFIVDKSLLSKDVMKNNFHELFNPNELDLYVLYKNDGEEGKYARRLNPKFYTIAYSDDTNEKGSRSVIVSIKGFYSYDNEAACIYLVSKGLKNHNLFFETINDNIDTIDLSEKVNDKMGQIFQILSTDEVLTANDLEIILNGYTLYPNLDYQVISTNSSKCPNYILFRNVIPKSDQISMEINIIPNNNTKIFNSYYQAYELVKNTEDYNFNTKYPNTEVKSYMKYKKLPVSKFITMDDDRNLFIKDKFDVFINNRKVANDKINIINTKTIEITSSIDYRMTYLYDNSETGKASEFEKEYHNIMIRFNYSDNRNIKELLLEHKYNYKKPNYRSGFSNNFELINSDNYYIEKDILIKNSSFDWICGEMSDESSKILIQNNNYFNNLIYDCNDNTLSFNTFLDARDIDSKYLKNNIIIDCNKDPSY